MGKFDETLFFWQCNEQLRGMLVVHVDDFLYSGSEIFEKKVVMKIKENFQISKEESQTFQLLGSQI